MRVALLLEGLDLLLLNDTDVAIHLQQYAGWTPLRPCGTTLFFSTKFHVLGSTHERLTPRA